MAKENKAEPVEINEPQADQNVNAEALAENAAALELLQVKHDALVDQVLVLENTLNAVQTENAVLREHLERLQQTTNSATIAPAAPAAPERPVVEVGGEKYRFKVGEVRLGRVVLKATAIAVDETKLYEVFSNYPGLFVKL